MDESKQKYPFSSFNYKVMIAGLVVLILGYILMKMETAKYGFGVLGLTVGPIIVALGFVIQFFAIMKTSKKDERN